MQDALALAAAISDPAKPSICVLPSDNSVLEAINSKTGCRRIDVPSEHPDFVRHGWIKLKAQNESKGSSVAARARAGAKIVHILPLQPGGSHPTNTWGLIEDGVLMKNANLAIEPESFKEYQKEKNTGRGKGADAQKQVEKEEQKSGDEEKYVMVRVQVPDVPLTHLSSAGELWGGRTHHSYMCLHIKLYACTHIHVCIHVYIYICVYIYIHVHVYMCTYIYICMYM